MAPASRYITCVVVAALVVGPVCNRVEAQRVTRKSDEERRAEYERYGFIVRASLFVYYRCRHACYRQRLSQSSVAGYCLLAWGKQSPTAWKGRASARDLGMHRGVHHGEKEGGRAHRRLRRCFWVTLFSPSQ